MLHGNDIMWFMTYSKTKTWRQSYVVNVPRHSSRQAKNSTWGRHYAVHDIFKDENMETKCSGKCTRTKFPTCNEFYMETILCGPRHIQRQIYGDKVMWEMYHEDVENNMRSTQYIKTNTNTKSKSKR